MLRRFPSQSVLKITRGDSPLSFQIWGLEKIDNNRVEIDHFQCRDTTPGQREKVLDDCGPFSLWTAKSFQRDLWTDAPQEFTALTVPSTR